MSHRFPRLDVSLRAVLSCGLLCGLVACSSAASQGPEPSSGTAQAEGPLAPSFEPIVFPHKDRGQDGQRQDVRALSDEESGWREKWELASRYAAGGYDEQALQVIQGCLAHGPPPQWRGRLQALKTSLRVRRAEDLLLRVDARGTRDYVQFGSDVDFVVRFRNVSDRRITMLPPSSAEASTSPTALMLEIRRHDRDIFATELRRMWTRTVFILAVGDEPIRIQPGGVHEIPVRIPAEAAGPPLQGLRVLELSGTLRPTRLFLGGEARTVRLPIRAGRVTALPANFEQLVSDPLRSMERSVGGVAPAHLLIASEFVPPNRRIEAITILARALAEGHPALRRAALSGLGLLRERTVGERLSPLAKPLVDALQQSPGRGDALMDGLSTLTGVRLAPDPRLWLEWWKRSADRRTKVTPVDPERRG